MHAVTAGNPFLLTELARHGAFDGTAVPPSIRDVLLARIERLPAPVRDAVRVGAVAGVEFELGAVAAALGRDDDDTISVLDHAVAAGLLDEIDGSGACPAFSATALVGRGVSGSRRPSSRALPVAPRGSVLASLRDLATSVARSLRPDFARPE